MSRRPAETSGQLVFQEGKQIDHEYYIVSIYDDSELRRFHLAAYELETDQTFVLTYSYSDFDSLFRFNADLLNPNNSDGRFHWAVERLDFIEDGGRRGLVLAQEPTKVGPTTSSYAAASHVKESLDDATLLFTKSEAARLKFLQELHSKFSLQQLKSRQRLLLLDEDMNKRRARLDATKHSLALKSKIVDERNRTKSSTIAEIEQLMRKKEEETVKRLLREKDRVKRELERRRVEALERRSNKEKSSRSNRKQELERKEILERKRREVEEQRTILLKKLARAQVGRRQTLLDRINQKKLHLIEAKRTRLATMEKAVSMKHETRELATETNRALEAKRGTKERRREQIRREIESDHVLKVKEFAKRATVEKNLCQVDAVERLQKRETERLALRKQRSIFHEKIAKLRVENVSKKLEVRKRKDDESKWKTEIPAAMPAAVADERDRWLREQDKEVREVERNAKRQEGLSQSKAVLQEDANYRKTEEAKKFNAWKLAEMNKIEQQQFRKIEHECLAKEQRERDCLEARTREAHMSELEKKRELNEQRREQARMQALVDKIKVLPPALAINI
jgi:hypothetical protein